MSDFEQFGEVLRQQLHAIVEDLHPSAELSAAVDALATQRRARSALLGRLNRKRIAIAVPVPIAGIAAAAVLLFAGSGPQLVGRGRDQGTSQWVDSGVPGELGDPKLPTRCCAATTSTASWSCR